MQIAEELVAGNFVGIERTVGAIAEARQRRGSEALAQAALEFAEHPYESHRESADDRDEEECEMRNTRVMIMCSGLQIETRN